MEGSLHEDLFVPSKPLTTSLILQTAAETNVRWLDNYYYILYKVLRSKITEII